MEWGLIRVVYPPMASDWHPIGIGGSAAEQGSVGRGLFGGDFFRGSIIMGPSAGFEPVR